MNIVFKVLWDITKDEHATLVKLGLTDSYGEIIKLCYFNTEEKS